MLKVYSSKYYTAVKLGYSQETDLERQKIYPKFYPLWIKLHNLSLRHRGNFSKVWKLMSFLSN